MQPPNLPSAKFGAYEMKFEKGRKFCQMAGLKFATSCRVEMLGDLDI
jgi:hypothetical protein